MRIIALRGDSDCGKTTTLNFVYEEITRNTLYCVDQGLREVLGNPDMNDFECIIRLADNRRIAFFTLGDYMRDIPSAIKKYAEQNVDILIIASNTKFHNHLMAIAEYHFTIVTKTIALPQNAINNSICNLQDSGTILSLI